MLTFSDPALLYHNEQNDIAIKAWMTLTVTRDIVICWVFLKPILTYLVSFKLSYKLY